ncbi:glycoside hydrolase family 3 N-terminal domain-containing protein [Lentzea sp.]|uniref:glycoside hydrolase family 3 N-terminal domain-containing protein n=1 Tax=Lentzea sp. TaxID=56099 RepID=UPI002C5EE454|nr:glycoside hydrolase family 3 N-terminal domain-containing protein [Lentzea sp.]HUQ61488.1 glycoside hydrolase family 3 N-terminal domain-containing protein [Lentzea sp.]
MTCALSALPSGGDREHLSCRQAGTFGQDSALTAELAVAYVRGFQGPSLGPVSVACTSEHFPGGGPQKDGEDAHFPYGREQVYPGGRFADHLAPFRAVVEAGRLPFDLPRSMEQVRRHHEDVAGYEDPLFPFGHGLSPR